MKITVSYISSIYDTKKTIDKINETSADAIHVDLMDGIYCGTKNFDINYLPTYFSDNKKDIELHLMLNNPSNYLDKLIPLKPSIIYIHPKTQESIISFFLKLDELNIKKGIAINPDEDISLYEHYFKYVDRILLMSVYPGKGGQKFLSSTIPRLNELISYKNKYNFEIYLDGGINDKVIKDVNFVDGIVSGSYICQSKDYEKQIKSLRN